ncbi:MAG: hypothetical protein M3Y29_02320, partial [Chloroflexota bacterium]|nr:hypothetical protein [Chloroflexota bacterium]
VVTARLRRRGRFALRYRPPADPGAVELRVRVRVGRRTLARSASWQVLLHRRARVVSAGTIVSAPPPGAAGDLRVNGRFAARAGDVIAAGIGPATPTGFLGRIVSARTEGGQTVFATVPATLPETLPEGAIEQHVTLGDLDTEARAGDDGERAGPRTGGPGTTPHEYGVNATLTCEAGAGVTVRGTIAISPTVDVSAKWKLFSGISARFVGGAQASAELAASAEAAASCNVGPQALFRRVLTPIEFTVGPVPVVIVPVLTVYLSASGRVEAHVDTEVHGTLAASAGLEYSKGSVHPVAQFTHDFGYTPPEPEGSASLGATLSPTLDLLLYGAGGPEAAFNVGLALHADPLAAPTWTLTAPISLTAKLAIPALGISTDTLTVYQQEFLLARSGEDGVQGQVHFDEYPLGTTIVDQYANVGVVFDSDTFISEDGSNPTAPVLSGVPLFHGEITGHFVVPGTSTPTAVNRLQLDTGFVDNPGSVEIVAQLADGRTRTAVADHLGIDQISIATRGIVSFTVREIDEEPAGFAIDNLGFGS